MPKKHEREYWIGRTGVTLIDNERASQKKRWGDAHDDEHEDRSLSYAACAYASPEPIYVKREEGMIVTFAEVWPDSWDESYDKRPRFRGMRDGELIPAEAMPIQRRLRQLQKAGALIASEMDRLIRRLENGEEGDGA